MSTYLIKLLRQIRNRHLFLLDIVLIGLGVWFSFAVRLDTLTPIKWLQAMSIYLATAMLARLVIFYKLNIYRRYWVFASVEELSLLFLAVTISTAAIAVILLGILSPLVLNSGFPRSVLLIDWLTALSLLGGSRFLIRMWGNGPIQTGPAGENGRQTPVLISGAGEAGGIIARELAHNPQLGLKAIGFVDDDPAKQGATVHGLPVLGACKDIPWLIVKHEIEQVIIAMPTAPGSIIRNIREMGQKTGVTVRTMPGIYEILSGQVNLQQIRDVQIEDLLRREQAQNDPLAAAGYLRHRRVAVTGAGGSIGSELCRQIAAIGPDLLLLVGHGENSIFEIEQELRRRFPATPVQSIIADIRDAKRMNWLFRTRMPHVVFHAAAHKHVPLMEGNVVEAVTNNVIGTRNVVRAAEAARVERLVMISSDKAVRSSSVMGASKRMAELVIQNTARRLDRPYVTVRFGNVLGSRGSVVPIFKKQIQAGGPITITHPEMTRYFMTIPEAVHLVLQAGMLGAGGEIFVLDMGQPIKILDLARDLIELSGLKPYEDIDIVFTGIRPGEKLHETLFYPDEAHTKTGHKKIMISQNGHRHIEHLDQLIDRLEELARDQDEAEIMVLLEGVLAATEVVHSEAEGSRAVGLRQSTRLGSPDSRPVGERFFYAGQ